MSKRMDIVDKIQSQQGDDIQLVFDKEALLREAMKEIIRLRKLNADMVELAASGGRLDGYRKMAAKIVELEMKLDDALNELEYLHELQAGEDI